MSNENVDENLEYDGHCAFAVSTGKTDVKGADNFLTKNGKTYAFSNPVAKFLFKLLPNRISKADSIWKDKDK